MLVPVLVLLQASSVFKISFSALLGEVHVPGALLAPLSTLT